MLEETTNNVGVARDKIRSVIERVEYLEEEKRIISDDISVVYAEAKSNGFDVKTLKNVVRLRKLEPAERQEIEAMLDIYMHALGMVPDTE